MEMDLILSSGRFYSYTYVGVLLIKCVLLFAGVCKSFLYLLVYLFMVFQDFLVIIKFK